MLKKVQGRLDAQNSIHAGAHIDGGARHEQEVAAELRGVGLLCRALHPHAAVKYAPPAAAGHDAPVCAA